MVVGVLALLAAAAAVVACADSKEGGPELWSGEALLLTGTLTGMLGNP